MQRQTNLYRNKHGIYFAMIKAGGKQIKRSLKCDDPALAKRRLAELRLKVERLRGAEQQNIRFEELTQLWLESVEPDLKPSSYERRVSAVLSAYSIFQGNTCQDNQTRHRGELEGQAWSEPRASHLQH